MKTKDEGVKPIVTDKVKKEFYLTSGSELLYGVIQPNDTEIEEAVIAAILIDKEAMDKVVTLLTPKMFYKSKHASIYRACVRLHRANQAIDILTVKAELEKSMEIESVGGGFGIAELTNRTLSGSNIEFHSALIYQYYMRREVIEVCQYAIRDAYDKSKDEHELVSYVESAMSKVQAGIYGEKETGVDAAMVEAYNWMMKASENQGLSGIPSGIETFDSALGGFTNGELIIVAARPGMGKTAFMLNCARNQTSTFGLPVGIVSLEMTRRELSSRMLASDALVDGEIIKRGTMTSDEKNRIASSIVKLSQIPLQIDDRSYLSIKKIRHIARRWKSKHNISALFVDYLQFMESDIEDTKGKTRNDQIAIMSRGLKNIAKDLDIPVIALSQLGRSVEENRNKIPQLKDLRESGAIEQDADVVVFLYCPDYYGYTADEIGNSTEGLCQAICAKNRNGKQFKASMKFERAFSLFTKWDFEITVPSDETKGNGSSYGTKFAKRKRGDSNTRAKDFSAPSHGDDSENYPF